MTYHRFHELPVLVDRLSRGLSRSSRKITFLVGAPLSSPELPHHPGVPGVEGMIELIRQELAADPTAERKFLEEIAASGSRYQTAFEILLGYRGQDVANDIVRRAVLKARNVHSLSGIPSDWKDSQDLEQLEQIDGWELPIGMRTLGKILVRHAGVFGQTVLTSNFDPLLEVSIRSNGGRYYRTVLHGDGDLSQTSAEGAHVVHFHGFWCGRDTLHTPSQLRQIRPKLSQSLSRLLERSTVVVVGYSGWDDVFTKTLVDVVIDDNSAPDVLWTFLEADEGVIHAQRQATLLQLDLGLNRGRINLFKGIDCNTFFPRLLEELSDERPSSAVTIGSEMTSRVVEVTDNNANQSRLEIRIALPPTRKHFSTDSPPRIDEWVGRTKELALLEHANVPAVIITGIGGQGKSALAAHHLSASVAAGAYDDSAWCDCREEGDRLNTQIMRLIGRVAGSAIDMAALDSTNSRALVDIFFDALADRQWLFVFDNVDRYVDLVTGDLLFGLGYLLDAIATRNHRSKFVLTCRPGVKSGQTSVLELPLTGLTEEESIELFRKRGVSGEDKSALHAAYTLTAGHPLWINLIATQVSRLRRPLIDVLAEIRRGSGELPEKTLRSIMAGLNRNQQTVLRTLAEAERPETTESLFEMVAPMTSNRFYKSLSTLKLLQLIVLKMPSEQAEVLELHPLVKAFIKREYPHDRDRFISVIVTYLDRMIGKYKGLLTKQPSLAILDHWTQKAELELNRGHYPEAIQTLGEVSTALIARGFSEEFVRVGKKLLTDIDWINACVTYREFDSVFERIIESMVQLGQYTEAIRFLEQYADSMPGISAQYINLCNLRCYLNWYRGNFEEAIAWGERGEELKARSDVDTAFSAAHNLALARRDSGEIAPALRYFLGGQTLAVVLDPEKFDRGRGGAFYGNIGRCLQFDGKYEDALVAYRRSAQLLEDDVSEKGSLNRGYIRLWIAEVLRKSSPQMAQVFFRAAYHQWRPVSPPRAMQAETALLEMSGRESTPMSGDASTIVEIERIVRGWLRS